MSENQKNKTDKSSNNIGWSIAIASVGVVGFIGGKLWEEHKYQTDIREMQKRVKAMERKNGITQKSQISE